MNVVGKSPPTPDELQNASDIGFDGIELYLTTEHLDDYGETLRTCQKAPVDVVSVHTPHITIEELQYWEEADQLAHQVGADVVCAHSSYINVGDVQRVNSDVQFRVKHGFENGTEVPLTDIRRHILDNGLEVTLDIAHLHRSVGADRYRNAIEELIVEHGDDIPIVHFTDATADADNLPLGAGDLDLEWTGQLLKDQYQGVIVLEVMPEHQSAAFQKFRSY